MCRTSTSAPLRLSRPTPKSRRLVEVVGRIKERSSGSDIGVPHIHLLLASGLSGMFYLRITFSGAFRA